MQEPKQVFPSRCKMPPHSLLSIQKIQSLVLSKNDTIVLLSVYKFSTTLQSLGIIQFSEIVVVAMSCFQLAIKLLIALFQLESQVCHLLFANLGLTRQYFISSFCQMIQDCDGVDQTVLLSIASYQ